MEAHRAWLAQGDVFEDAPVLDVELGPAGLVSTVMQGPAVLLTHGCAMDKANPDSTLKMPFLQFAALRSATALEPQRAANLRGSRNRLTPYDAMWLGEISQFGDCYVLLSDPYYLPCAFFSLRCVQYEESAGPGPNNPRATASVNDSRIGRLEPEQVALLQRKMAGFWTRFEPRLP